MTIPNDVDRAPLYFSTYAQLALSAVDKAVNRIVVGNHAALGDRGGATLERLSADPGTGAAYQSGDGAWWGPVPTGIALDIRQFGGVKTDGEANAAAILAAWKAAVAAGGGSIYIPEGDWVFDNVVFTQTSVMVKIHGAGLWTTRLKTSTPDATVPATWMWRFSKESEGGTRLWLEDLEFVGDTRTLIKNMVWVDATNSLRVVNCRGRGVDGTVLRAERVWNGYIDLTTVTCGNSGNGDWAMVLCADATTGTIGNDVLLGGTTEQDELGWRLDNMVNVRSHQRIKVHGGASTERAMLIHRCRSTSLDLLMTFEYGNDSLVCVTDASNTQTIDDFTTDPVNNDRCVVTLDVVTFSNLLFNGDAAVGAALWIDCAFADTLVRVEGFVDLISTGSSAGYTFAKLTGGHADCRVDLSRLQCLSSNPDRKFFDGRSVKTPTYWGAVPLEPRAGEEPLITIANAADTGLRIKAAASQTGNIMEWLSSADAVIARIDSAGNVGGTGAYTSLSDVRTKQDVVAISEPGALLEAVVGRRYRRRGADRDEYGFVAQELLEAVPEAVVAFGDDYLGIQTDQIVALLVEEVKALRLRLSALEA